MLNKKLLFLGICLAVFSTAISQTKTPKEQQVEFTTTQGKIVVKLYNETPKHRDNFIKLVKRGLYDSLLFHGVIPQFMIQSGDPQSKYAPKDSLTGISDLGYSIPSEIQQKYYHKRGALGAALGENPKETSSSSQFYIITGRTFSYEELSGILNQINFSKKQAVFQKVLEVDSIKMRFNDYAQRGDKEGMQVYLNGLQPLVNEVFAPLEFRYTPELTKMYTTIGGAPHLDLSYTVFGEVILGMEVVDKIAAMENDKNNRPLKDVRILKARLLP